MNKRAQSYDKCFADIQNLVATGVVPIIKLFELLKPQIAGNSEIKTLFSDTITMMGQVQYNLSLRRRYMIKPHLKKKYQNLCHVSMPISTKLFGDDVTKDVKNCDTGVSLAKDSYPGFYGYNKPFRARGGYSRGVYSRGSRGGFRYHLTHRICIMVECIVLTTACSQEVTHVRDLDRLGAKNRLQLQLLPVPQTKPHKFRGGESYRQVTTLSSVLGKIY
ncbi:MAG: hypothetical protein N0E59_21335 [Candidatus Thiodiazotropha taylori]|nr:hypothetical protein [Candidatus Thiodiazotropha taylori]MCW4285664.1 hypothetical protein [Candidatus Thiodiazotropha taylori]